MTPVRLTEREAEVLRLLAAGRSQKNVAAQLGISVSTVRAHLANARRANQVERTSRLVYLSLTENP